MCKDAAELVQRVEEKKLLLAALGGISSPEAIAQILPFADDSAVREEACVAVVNIAERMAKSRTATKLAPKVVAALEKVGQTTANADLAKRAKTLVDSNK
jgi:glutamate racemase